MCDTLYAGPGACSGGHAWFAKNSDRKEDEPQALCLVGRRGNAKQTSVGKRSFPVQDRGYAFALSKPSWIAGGEMGINEKGVAIGNEAVFSRFPAAAEGVLGMDILRAALRSCGSAKDAVDFICRFIEAEDQGGNGAYRGKLVYSNSYIVAGFDEAFVLETAGRRWAWRQIDGIATISNAYSIEEDYKRLDARTRKEIAPVNDRAACSDEADAGRVGRKESWRRYVERRFYLRFTKGDLRRAALLSALDAARGSVSMATVLGSLRSHGIYDPRRANRGNMASLCVHAGGLLNMATTASLAVEYGLGAAVLWFAGTSYPCLSLYKPMLLAEGSFIPLWTEYDYAEGAISSYAHWARQHTWIRKARAGAKALEPAFVKRRDTIQTRIAAAASAAAAGGDLEEARRTVNEAVREWYEGLPGW